MVGGERAFVVSHLSSFTCIHAIEEFGTQFQLVSIVDKSAKKNGASIASYKDA